MLGRLQDQPPELMEELFHENVIIGKIGLYPPEMMPHPRDELFLKTQKNHFLDPHSRDDVDGLTDFPGPVLVSAQTREATDRRHPGGGAEGIRCTSRNRKQG